MSSTSCVEILRSALRAHCDYPGAETDEGIFVDFENAQPTETEQEVYILTGKVLSQAELVLKDLSTYGNGATDEIRVAITKADDEVCQAEAWRTILLLVRRLRTYYELSVRLEQVSPLLLWELVSGPLPPSEQLESRQALSKQFAQILDFVLRFDEIKMATPAVQNDFRAQSRQQCSTSYTDQLRQSRVTDSQIETNLQLIDELPDDLTTTMSFFFASPTPMLNTLIHAISDFVAKHSTMPITNITDILATMVSVCRSMVDTPEFVQRMSREQETRWFCLRVMVGGIILYDHLHPSGAFARNTQIDIRAAVRVLKSQTLLERSEPLLNALRYTTRHLNDSTTPKCIKSILL